MNKLEARVLTFVIARGFCVCVCARARVCLRLEKPPALDSIAWLHSRTATNNTLASTWWNLEASSKLYVNKTGVSHLKTGGKESPF